MVNDILDFARGRLGTPMPLILIGANLETLVREIADEVQSANPEVSIEVDTNGDLSGEWDTERLKQLLSNLLLNAIQHGNGSNVVVTANSDDNLVLVEVCNEGPPIPKELLGTMFDPPVHGRSSDSEEQRPWPRIFYCQRNSFRAWRNNCSDFFTGKGNHLPRTPAASFALGLNNAPNLFRVRDFRTGVNIDHRLDAPFDTLEENSWPKAFYRLKGDSARLYCGDEEL